MELPKIQLNKRKKAFTLIELLVVISIIGILFVVMFVSYTKARLVARDNQRKADLRAVMTAVQQYYSQTGQYPVISSLVYFSADPSNPSLTTGLFQCADGTIIFLNQRFFCQGQLFMGTVPIDPLASRYTNAQYRKTQYYVPPFGTQNGNLFLIYAAMENTSSPDVYPQNTTFPKNCYYSNNPVSGMLGAPSSKYNYCVANP